MVRMMNILGNTGRFAFLLAVAGLSAWSLGCAEKPTADVDEHVESGSGVREGVDVHDHDGDHDAHGDEEASAEDSSDASETEKNGEVDNTPLPLLPPANNGSADDSDSEADTTPLPTEG